MNFDMQHSTQTKRCYPVLGAFDLALNFSLCCGVFALGCAVLGVILSHSMPTLTAQVVSVATQFFR